MSGAISKYEKFCDGFFSPTNQGDGYIIAPVLGVGKDLIKFGKETASLLDEINVFDIAEISDTYLGQINMITVSSFCGSQGLIWGYDIAKAEKNEIETSVHQNSKNISGNIVPIYSMKNIETAAKKLFGTKERKIYPLKHGSHVPCAAKQITACEEEWIYSAIGFGIPDDREKAAVMIMEDVGLLNKEVQTEGGVLQQLSNSILQIGINQNITIKEIYVSIKSLRLDKGEVGCALVAVPYFSLAQKATYNNDLSRLKEISIVEWQHAFSS